MESCFTFYQFGPCSRGNETVPQVGVNTIKLNAYSTLYTNSIQSPQRHGNYAVIITNPQLGCMRGDMIRLRRMV